jgi:hypothetical protein
MSTPSKDESAASAVAVADTETGADVAAVTDVGPGAGAAPDADASPSSDAGPGSDAGSDAARERRPRWRVAWLIRLAWLVGLIAVGIGLYLCYLHVSRTERVSSDGASNALQAWAMLHGNPMLRGWTVTDVSFYTTELPEYMLVEHFRGLNADVLHMSAAISYTLVVLTGAMLARGRATGREGIVRMLIAAGIMIAPQLGPGVFILVFQPDHIGTQAPLLLTWLVLDRAPRRWYVPILVGAMLAWIEVADRLALLIGVAPLAAVSAIWAYQVLAAPRGAAGRLVRPVPAAGGGRLGGDRLGGGQADRSARRICRAAGRERAGPDRRDVGPLLAGGGERVRALRRRLLRHLLART